MIPTVLGSLSLRQGGTWGAYYGPMERSPIGWLNGLISCICSAWLNGIVSLNVLSWTEQSSPRHTHSASMRDRWSRWHYYYQCHVTDIYRTSVFTEIATSHRLKKTPLCVRPRNKSWNIFAWNPDHLSAPRPRLESGPIETAGQTPWILWHYH